jgi:hypothetical protein
MTNDSVSPLLNSIIYIKMLIGKPDEMRPFHAAASRIVSPEGGGGPENFAQNFAFKLFNTVFAHHSRVFMIRVEE